MTIKLIGLTGEMGSGKDTAALALVLQCGFVRVAFADAIRETLTTLDPHIITSNGPCKLSTIIRIEGWDRAKRNHPEIRKQLQDLGHGLRTIVGDDVWMRPVASAIENARRNGATGVVISDVRYPNEADFIRQTGGLVVQITWPGSPHRPRLAKKHASEVMNFRADTTITNTTGHPEKMESRVCDIARAMEGNPTPTEIWEETRQIQSGWTPGQERAARAHQPTRWEIPEYDSHAVFATVEDA